MPKKYRTGAERLAAFEPDTLKRYAIMLENVRANFTGFEDYNGYDADYIDRLSDSQRKQLRRYYNALSRYIEGGQVHKIRLTELPKAIRNKGTKGVDAVMRAAQMGHYRGRAKFIFLHWKSPSKPRVKIADDGLTPIFVDKKMGLSQAFIEIHPESYILAWEQLRDELKEQTKGASFMKIANGNYELPFMTTNVDLLMDEISRLQSKYSNWSKWLTGVKVYYSDKPIKQTLETIKANKEAFRERIKKGQAKAKAKRRAKK